MQKSKYFIMLVMAIVMTSAIATAKTTIRPIEDFLNVQGTTVSFVPPVADYLGWADNGFVNFALVDYAGLAANYVTDETGVSLGTKFTGHITEKVLKDGRRKVTILLKTKNALAWGFEIADMDPNDPLPFLNTPLAFGTRAQDVVLGVEPTLGKVSMQVVFIDGASPGDPLPDLVQLMNAPAPDQEMVSLDFRARAKGPLHAAFGVPEGTPGTLRVQEKCAGNPCTFSKEIVDIRVVGGND
jgi:hypothetical protein